MSGYQASKLDRERITTLLRGAYTISVNEAATLLGLSRDIRQVLAPWRQRLGIRIKRGLYIPVPLEYR